MATLVLVHGTTAGGWIWKHIASRLREAGHEVFTPTLTGLGEWVNLRTRDVGLDTHIGDFVKVLRYELGFRRVFGHCCRADPSHPASPPLSPAGRERGQVIMSGCTGPRGFASFSMTVQNPTLQSLAPCLLGVYAGSAGNQLVAAVSGYRIYS